MGCTHSRALSKLANVIVKTLSIIFERPWRAGEVLEDQTKSNVTPTYRKGKKEELGNDRLVSFTLILGKVMEQIILPTISNI